ncbi:MAG: winged helix-turn-helix domain-containing protein [Bdellovibrionales bacterium]|jgi:DNA-binding response OmpR family regulator
MFFIGLISPDQPLCQALGEQLKQAGDDFHHALFASVEEALGAWSEALPPLILWDAQEAPVTEAGAAVFAARLSAVRPEPLLLVLGEAPQALEKWGVAETFSRPLRLGFLLSRLQFYQRQYQQASDGAVSIGDWRFEPRARQLTHKATAEVVKLTDKEAVLLDHLWEATAPALRDELLAAIWGYDTRIDTHTLETHIYRLRRKIMGEKAGGDDVFLSDQGGYQINPLWRKE